MTKTFVLRLIEDVLAAGAPVITHARPCHRAVYAVEGSATLRDRQGERHLASDRALRCEGPLTLAAPQGARLWRFELLAAPAASDGRLGGPGARSEVKLSVETALPPAAAWLLRCDRVDFPPGADTPRHTHAGPGIRCLLMGEVDAEIGAARARYRAGEAWFEAGPDPVVGRPSPSGPTAFVRLMVLPRELLGKPSFRYWSKADEAIPRTQGFRLFFDEPIEI